MADGAGEEIFSLSEDGELSTVANPPKQCVVAAAYSDSRELALAPCGSSPGAVVEATASNQVKLPKLGNVCLSVAGDPGQKDIFPSKNSIDPLPMRWLAQASKPVDFIVSLGDGAFVRSIALTWEYAPKQVELALSDGGRFTPLTASTVNALNTTLVSAGGAYGRTLRVRMKEPLNGGSFSLLSLRVIGSSATVALQDCASASASSDARDKFFWVTAPSVDPTLASVAADAASLAVRAANRLAGLTLELTAALEKGRACSLAMQHKLVLNSTLARRGRTQTKGIRATVNGKSVGANAEFFSDIIASALNIIDLASATLK
jgi:hypothetical protein